MEEDWEMEMVEEKAMVAMEAQLGAGLEVVAMVECLVAMVAERAEALRAVTAAA